MAFRNTVWYSDATPDGTQASTYIAERLTEQRVAADAVIDDQKFTTWRLN